MKGSIKITNPINKSLLIVYCSFNFGKENTTISGKTIEGQPYAYPPPQTSTETQIMMILIIYQTLPAALIENSHFNSKLVCLAMLKLYSKVLAKPSPLVSRWRASFQSRHAGIVWYILKYHYIFEFHLLVDMFLFAFILFILSFYSLISCPVFQFCARSVFTI